MEHSFGEAQNNLVAMHCPSSDFEVMSLASCRYSTIAVELLTDALGAIEVELDHVLT